MKYRTFYTIALLMAVLLMGGCSVWEPSTTQRAEATPSFDILDEYGWWVELPDFGIAWQPDVDPSWRPYTYGHWIWTDQGWYWAGYEPFAWIVYHYGYWYYDRQQGWFWLEGDEWSPSRVQWILGEDYAGWAPMPPPKATLIEPWQEGGSALWAYVPYSGFLRENPARTPRGRNTPPRGWQHGSDVTRHGPEVKTIEGATDRKLPERKVDVRDVEVGGRTWMRAELPAEDAVIVKSHAAEVGQVVHKRTDDRNKGDATPQSPARREADRPMVPIQSDPVPQPAQPQHRAVEQNQPVRQEPEQKKTEVNQKPPKAKADPPPSPPKQPEVQKKDEPKQEKPKEASTKPDR